MALKNFFEESRDQSMVKAEIVEKYFDTWATIIAHTQNRYYPNSDNKIGYVDLFAGPGRYKDGSISTPLRVLKKAISNDVYCKNLITVFNDKDDQNTNSLKIAIQELSGIEKLEHKPKIWNQEVGDQIAKNFAKINTIPILAFIDPWGYKGLSLNLVNAFLKNWGCDCIFFFNYSRINAGLSNPKVKSHMEALFGIEKAEKLGIALDPLSPVEREATIIEALSQSLKKAGHRFVLPFCFKNASGKRTTHHLILVTKHFKGYEVMKQIMAKASSDESQGVPSFTFIPPTSQYQLLLFDLNRPLDDLRGLLLAEYAGKQMSMKDIYMHHSIDKPYLSANYKDVLRQLEDDGVIQVFGRKSRRGFADYLQVQFPQRS